ncbi:MAG: protein kinase [Planctomycetota bacterium]|nr:protein kinase [Planctomycetota bacterium]
MSTSDSHSTHIPGSPTAGGATQGSFSGATSFPPEDLSSDQVIKRASRIDYQGRAFPTLGGIPLVARLGEGGMGAVYYGFHVRLDQEVAVKVLPFQRATLHPHLIQRFYREARMAAKVRSQHLVGVLDINEENGLYYLVMEFVKGVSAGGALKRMLASGLKGLHETDALDLCIAATEGVAAAHTQGIVHRDIKPDNILVPEDPPGSGPRYARAKLADLGLARGDTGTTALTGVNAMMGSPGFLAPEQAMDARSAGKRSDVFSMGATLFALLAGQPPFTGANALAAAYASVKSPHRPIRELRPDVSLATAALIDRCLAKRPEDRYADGTALLQGLRLCRQQLGLGEALQHSTIEQLTILVNKAEVGQPYQYESDVVDPNAPVPPPLTPRPVNVPQTEAPQAPPQIPGTIPQTYQPPGAATPYPPTAGAISPVPGQQGYQAGGSGQQPAFGSGPPAPAGSGNKGLAAVLVLMGIGAAVLVLVTVFVVLAASGKLNEWTQGPPVPLPPAPPVYPTPVPPVPPAPVPVPVPVVPPAPVPVPVPVRPNPPQEDPFETGLKSVEDAYRKGDLDAALNGYLALKAMRADDRRVREGIAKVGKALLERGDAAANGNPKEPALAVTLYGQAERAFQEIDDHYNLFIAIFRQGLNTQPNLNPQGNWDAAVDFYDRCVDLAQERKLEGQEGEAQYQLGFAHMPGMLADGSWRDAIEYYQKALRLATRTRFKELENNTYHALGYCYELSRNTEGNWVTAAYYYGLSAKGREAEGKFEGAATVLNNQGICHSPALNTRGNPDQAMRCFGDALKMAQKANSALEQGRAYLNMGFCMQPNFNARTGNWATALQHHQQASRIFESINNKPLQANALFQTAVCMMANNRGNMNATTRQILQRAAALYRELNDQETLEKVNWWFQ